MNVLIAIAALCGTATYSRVTEDEVLSCQKYYIQCMKTQLNQSIGSVKLLGKCVLEKKKLGGSK